ncbi:MAG: hypothetical protein ACLQUY_24160, partial [Ktedonobacterales bacterium]
MRIHGCLYAWIADERAITHTLAGPERVAQSKLLPFQFYSALKALEQASGGPGDALKQAVNAALEQSFVNMPDLGRRVLIANDISGSMSSKPSAKSE